MVLSDSRWGIEHKELWIIEVAGDGEPVGQTPSTINRHSYSEWFDWTMVSTPFPYA